MLEANNQHVCLWKRSKCTISHSTTQVRTWVHPSFFSLTFSINKPVYYILSLRVNYLTTLSSIIRIKFVLDASSVQFFREFRSMLYVSSGISVWVETRWGTFLDIITGIKSILRRWDNRRKSERKLPWSAFVTCTETDVATSVEMSLHWAGNYKICNCPRAITNL